MKPGVETPGCFQVILAGRRQRILAGTPRRGVRTAQRAVPVIWSYPAKSKSEQLMK